MTDILQHYEAEQAELHDLLSTLTPEQWARPTPAAGWDVKDQVSHLADTEEVALDTLTGGPRSLNVDAARYQSGEAFTEAGCERGRGMTGDEVLVWWWSAAARVREQLRVHPRDQRVPWGLGMGWRAFVTARLMEHWAHGLDIRAGLEVPSIDTDRLEPIAWICTSALPYAFSVAGVEPPAGHTLRLDLVGPEGQPWTFGPQDATDTIIGSAGEWCRVAVQRLDAKDATSLQASGPLAEMALRCARAFL